MFHSVARETWFEVASKAEIQALLDIGVTGERIFFSNPVKQMAHIEFAVKHGIKLFVYDSETEIEKLAQFNNPDDPLEVYVRMPRAIGASSRPAPASRSAP